MCVNSKLNLQIIQWREPNWQGSAELNHFEAKRCFYDFDVSFQLHVAFKWKLNFIYGYGFPIMGMMCRHHALALGNCVGSMVPIDNNSYFYCKVEIEWKSNRFWIRLVQLITQVNFWCPDWSRQMLIAL